MSRPLHIALDAMGGDKAPRSVVQGARIALKEYPHLRFTFYGDESILEPKLRKIKALKDVSEIIHTDEVVQMHDKPSYALRKLKKSSMRLAINAVSDGKADAVVSAGNTGALMATTKFVFKTLPGIARPAFAAFIPAKIRKVALLDMGANVDCTPEHLVQFAIMGDAYARAVQGVERPKVALLNVGEEELKGHELVQSAHQLLKETSSSIDYHGFVEGNDILEGTVDVVVTDGFTGNITLKTAEGSARLIYDTLKDAIKRSFWAKVGFLFAAAAIKREMKKFDPRVNNGAILLGLNGIAVKSHGSADPKAFAAAIKLAVKLIQEDINHKIIDELTEAAIKSTVLSQTESAIAPRPSESIN
ncbi:MAG: phosphate acyltransferase PlsX [Rickettsiales bacterium]|nr:phosphate acyltransferase PlsX [Rickettsiales bacterium]